MPHKIVVVGGVCQEPKLFGKVLKFGLASTEGKDKNKYFNCVAFESGFHPKGWELLVKLVKGSQLMVDGKLEDGEYTNKDKVVVKTQDLVVSGFNFVGGKKSEGVAATETKTASPSKAAPVDPDDDLPF